MAALSFCPPSDTVLWIIWIRKTTREDVLYCHYWHSMSAFGVKADIAQAFPGDAQLNATD